MAIFSNKSIWRILVAAVLLLALSSCVEKEPEVVKELLHPSYNKDVCLNEISTEEDFIELYNGSQSDVDLKHWSIRKDGEEVYFIRNNVVLKSGEFAIISFGENWKYYREGTYVGHCDVGLSGKKSSLIELRNPVGRVIDYFANTVVENPTQLDKWGKNWPEIEFGSAMRYGDGSANWYVGGTITPGCTNVRPGVFEKFSDRTVNFEASLSDVKEDNVEEGVKYLFDESYIPEVHIEVSKDQWNKLLTKYDETDGKTKDYINCDMTLKRGDDVFSMSDIGIRLRGQTSRRRPEGYSGRLHKTDNTNWHHCHFILDFDRNTKDADHEILGVRKVALKWMKDDPSYVRERFCYDFLKRFGIWTAINTTYCRLWIHVEGDSNPAYFGVYQLMETIDNRYIKARMDMFGYEKGFLWKCGGGSGLTSTSDSKFKYDDNSLNDVPYEFKGDEEDYEKAKAQVKRFITDLNAKSGTELKNWANSIMDVKFFMRTYATLVACGHWDEYWADQNNWYMYFSGTEETGYTFYYLPYDFDNTLGTSISLWFDNSFDSGRRDPLNWGYDGAPLVKKLLGIPEFKQYYVDALHELASEGNDYFNYAASKARIIRMQDTIRDYVYNDTYEDTKIYDSPASWGNHPEYRLLEDCNNNFFKVKCAVMAAVK